MKERLRNAIENCAEETRPYSGRGMFGRECLGVITRDAVTVGEFWASVLYELGTLDADDVNGLACLMIDARMDSLYRCTIIYFPSVSL